MNSAKENRADIIRQRLESHFAPTHLEVIDESEQHLGHAGYQGGHRHFAIVISASALNGISAVAAHRKIYALFADMMPEQIHALRIKVI